MWVEESGKEDFGPARDIAMSQIQRLERRLMAGLRRNLVIGDIVVGGCRGKFQREDITSCGEGVCSEGLGVWEIGPGTACGKYT